MNKKSILNVVRTYQAAQQSALKKQIASNKLDEEAKVVAEETLQTLEATIAELDALEEVVTLPQLTEKLATILTGEQVTELVENSVRQHMAKTPRQTERAFNKVYKQFVENSKPTNRGFRFENNLTITPTGSLPLPEQAEIGLNLEPEKDLLSYVVNGRTDKPTKLIPLASLGAGLAAAAKGAPKVKIDVSLNSQTVSAQAYAGVVVVDNIDLLGIDTLDEVIEKLLMRGLRNALNGLVSSTLASGSAFNLPNFKVVTPNFLDAVNAAITQVQSKGGKRIVVAVNPLDYRQALSIKNTQGTYVANAQITEGVEYIADASIAQGNIAAFDRDYVAIDLYKDLIFKTIIGNVVISNVVYTTDETNKTAVLLEQYAMSYIVDPNAVVYSPVTTIITAITQ